MTNVAGAREALRKLIWSLLKRLPQSVVDGLRRVHYLKALKASAVSAEPELIVVAALVKSGDCCVDIGANFGLYTKELSRLVGERGWVYSFEAVPSTHSIMVANLKRLGVRNVRAFPFAVSDSNGNVTITIPRWSYGAPNYYVAHVAGHEEKGESIVVECCRIDTILATLSSSIAFVKCDVEGHELRVLRGASNFIRRHKPAWLIEISGDPDAEETDAAKVVCLLGKEGYDMYRFDGRLLVPRKPGDRSINYFFLQDDHVRHLRAAGLV